MLSTDTVDMISTFFVQAATAESMEINSGLSKTILSPNAMLLHGAALH